ncbi:hypothetical protein RN001_013046 [Aquatica leii]|uniref:PH domain-containing protein n=1 Tax=Aquatica leii TaxID=1421715 RepID=A0AAN7P1R9_9COLE|nr:hypothetical protein RN001_013046 [Aquatica leii]
MSESAYNSPLFNRRLTESCCSSPARSIGQQTPEVLTDSDGDSDFPLHTESPGVPDQTVISGWLKFRDNKKWKQRWGVITKLSPAAGEPESMCMLGDAVYKENGVFRQILRGYNKNIIYVLNDSEGVICCFDNVTTMETSWRFVVRRSPVMCMLCFGEFSIKSAFIAQDFNPFHDHSYANPPQHTEHPYDKYGIVSEP